MALVLATSACGSSGGGGGGDDQPDAARPDAPIVIPDARVDAPPPACVPGYLDLCQQAAPTTALNLTEVLKINTDTDPNCRVVTQNGGPAICLHYYTSVNIPVGAALIAYGNRPFALAAAGELRIEGIIDIATRRDRPPAEFGAGSLATCAFATTPVNDGGGGGGGAGGSFATAGGDGGTGDLEDGRAPAGSGTGGTHGAVATLATLRGGCPGQRGENNTPGSANGLGGRGGGAIYLTGRTVQISGKIYATGASGTGGGADDQGGGGGGGGSGGAILIQGATVNLAASALLLATGAGGGQGGSNVSLGEVGEEPLSTTAAAGGDQMANGGHGGSGATSAAGSNGASNNFGGGGGGGAAGHIRILSPAPTITSTTIAPPHTVAAQ